MRKTGRSNKVNNTVAFPTNRNFTAFFRLSTRLSSFIDDVIQLFANCNTIYTCLKSYFIGVKKKSRYAKSIFESFPVVPSMNLTKDGDE